MKHCISVPLFFFFCLFCIIATTKCVSMCVPMCFANSSWPLCAGRKVWAARFKQQWFLLPISCPFLCPYILPSLFSLSLSSDSCNWVIFGERRRNWQWQSLGQATKVYSGRDSKTVETVQNLPLSSWLIANCQGACLAIKLTLRCI